MNEAPTGSGRGEDDAPHLAQHYSPSTEIRHLTSYEQSSSVYADTDSKFDLNDYCYADADYEPSARHNYPTSCAASKDSSDASRSISQIPQQYALPSYETGFPRDTRNHDGMSGANYPIQSHMILSPYNPQPCHFPEVLEDHDRMVNSKHQPPSTDQRKHDPNSKYGPYTGQFNSTESASQYRKQATRFSRKPYRPPDTDETIAEVERERMYHVERIYNAMTRGDAARDNKGSIAMKRWVHGAYYKAELVEAYSHKVLDCLLLQAKEGFRGWVHNDYVADDRKGEDEDRDVTCEERLESILRALEEEKTICEDVMNSACQIRMFVNAPKAYANRKFQNRVGNSKRGKPKDFDVSEPPPKVRKVNSRPIARPRRRTGSNVITEPDLHARIQSQALTPSTLQQSDMRFLTPPPYPSRSDFHGVTRFVPSHIQAHVPQHAYSNSPSQVISPSVRQVHTMPPQQQTPLISTPVLSYGNHSAPPSPEDPNTVYNPETGSWSSLHPCQPAFDDALLFDEPWPGRQPGHIRTGPIANLFAARPEAAKEALSPSQHGSITANGLPEYWNHQREVQPLPNIQESCYEDRSSLPRG